MKNLICLFNVVFLQQVTFKQLVEKNKKYEQVHGRPSSASVLSLPFIAIKADPGTVIDCSISQDKLDIYFVIIMTAIDSKITCITTHNYTFLCCIINLL